MIKHTLLIACIFWTLPILSQAPQKTPTRKTLAAQRTTTPPKIDAVLDDEAWKTADVARDFIMQDPGSGIPEPETRKSSVKIVYDDEAIYISAILLDSEPSKIATQYSSRDRVQGTDYFQVNLNPNNDGLNDTEFFVMSSGVQADAKARTSGGGSFRRKDFSWSAVWYSAVELNDKGWVVEMKIPYSALRFSNTNIQNWGINFFRKMYNHNETYSWNYIDKTKGNYTQYAGILTGIENVKPPVRLNFSPYASASLTTYDGESEFEKSYGMDLKYGINESFTLDATLIPDFGQAAFDDQVLNLGPFEQQYKEQRAFFTEGTELFDKGRLFYSRRIGNAPIGTDEMYDQLGENESVINSPSEVNMINAIKISGRTKKGLGIGVFNAITEKTTGTVENDLTGDRREVVVEPIANYSVLVLDQQFNRNSSVSLVNTNVLREGHFRDANVTAFLFDISDKENKYNIEGYYKMSNVYENSERNYGYTTNLRVGKTHGNIQYDVGYWHANDTYDISDLGFQRRNNYSNFRGDISYRIFEPTERFNSINVSMEVSLNYLSTGEYTGNQFEFRSYFTKKNRFSYGISLETNIGDQYDYYEPRVDGRYFKENGVFDIGPWFSTDFRKKFALEVRTGYSKKFKTDHKYYSLNISPRYRFSDKFSINYSLRFSKHDNEKAYVTDLDDESTIIFGNREFKTITNSISGKLSFNTKSALSLSFRHNWSPVTYDDQFFELNSEGTLDTSDYYDDHNINYNVWNLDLSYAWEFAPGSQLVALYRNSFYNVDEQSYLSFQENLDNLFSQPVTHNFSVKFIYYLDYNKLRSWL